MNFKDEKNITIFEHPLIKHKISLLRDKNTGTNEFRKLVEEIASLKVLKLCVTLKFRMWRLKLLSKSV